MSLQSNKAAGPDGLSPRLYKEARHYIAPSLTRLFNLYI
jgi:hypothetical protein